MSFPRSTPGVRERRCLQEAGREPLRSLRGRWRCAEDLRSRAERPESPGTPSRGADASSVSSWAKGRGSRCGRSVPTPAAAPSRRSGGRPRARRTRWGGPISRCGSGRGGSRKATVRSRGSCARRCGGPIRSGTAPSRFRSQPPGVPGGRSESPDQKAHRTKSLRPAKRGIATGRD